MNKRKISCLVLALVLLMTLLTGCQCKHEWEEANCKAPKTCTQCGETEGEKTKDHKWEDATTEAPKTCSVCGETEGEKINTDERFTTAACKDLFGTWNGTMSMTAAEMGLSGTGNVEIEVTYTFTNDGKMECAMKLKDLEGYTQLMVDLMYEQFAAQGMNSTQAQDAVKEAYGMTIEEFCAKTAEEVAKSLAAATVTMVYYVADGKVFSALTWDDEMTGNAFSMKNGALHMTEDGKELILNKVNA